MTQDQIIIIPFVFHSQGGSSSQQTYFQELLFCETGIEKDVCPITTILTSSSPGPSVIYPIYSHNYNSSSYSWEQKTTSSSNPLPWVSLRFFRWLNINNNNFDSLLYFLVPIMLAVYTNSGNWLNTDSTIIVSSL